MSMKRNRHTPANSAKLVYIFHNLQAIPKMKNVDLTVKYLADVEAVLLDIALMMEVNL